MLKFGDKNITKLYHGDKAISKAYLGEKLVYQAGKPIFLDYVESTGSQWINTDIIPNQNDIEIEIDCEKGINAGAEALVVSMKSYGRMQLSINLWGTTQPYFRYGLNDLNKPGVTLRNRHKYKMTPQGAYIDDELVFSFNEGTNFIGNTNKIFLLAGSSDEHLYGFGGKIYGYKFWQGGVLVQDLRPCIHPNGTVCLYDMVTKKYFYNQGTGTLKAGGRFVESIVSDGNCYINTGIKASYDYTIKTKYMYTSFVGAYNCIFGTRSEAVSEGNKIYWVGCNSTGTKDLMMRMGKTTLPYSLKLNEVIDLEITPNEAMINGTNLGDAMFDGEIGFDSNIYLFNINMNSDGSTALFASVARMYNFQIYNNNMELIQDLRPYVDADGVACFKDIVTGKLFYNQGTGKLEYTE